MPLSVIKVLPQQAGKPVFNIDQPFSALFIRHELYHTQAYPFSFGKPDFPECAPQHSIFDRVAEKQPVYQCRGVLGCDDGGSFQLC